jgi:hypothetical protein
MNHLNLNIPIEEQALALINQKRSPELWGTGYDFDAKNAIEIWEWAEKNSKTTFQAEIADIVATQYILNRRNPRPLQAKLKTLTSQARAVSDWNRYVGFLEGLSVLEENNWDARRVIEEKICEKYAVLDNPQRWVWHLELLAHIYARTQSYEKAKPTLLHGYQISLQHYHKISIARILLGAGLVTDAQGHHLLACRLIYQAKLIFDEVKSIFYITARDILGNVAAEHQIDKGQYEASISVENLMDEFTKL